MTVALIVAAGGGQRLRAGVPKALVPLAGKTLLQRSVDALCSAESVDEIVVALPVGVPAPEGMIGVTGGLTRSESVREALSAASEGEDSDVVLVHDAARPLVDVQLIERVIAAAGAAGVDAAVAAAPVSDTIKRAEQGGEPLPRVTQTLRRSGLWAVQTPQAFRRGALACALSQPVHVLRQATDDASLVEGLGGTVVIVPSSPQNIKITTPFDLQLASLLLRLRRRD